MLALVKTASGRGNIELREVPVPPIGDDDVLMKVSLCGICGSDLHIEEGVHDSYPPVILGHEYTGLAAKVGKNVSHIDEGDRISFFRSPKPFPGYRADGGFAEYMRLEAKYLWRTPAGISDQDATQFETVRVPLDIVRDTAQLRPGERAVVSGPGHVGLLVTNIAKLENAGHITVLGGPGDEKVRLPVALEIGADMAEKFSEAALATLKNGEPPKVWFECSGAATAIKAAVDTVAYGGRVIVSGIGKGPWDIDMWKVARQNITIRGRWGGKESYVEESVPLIRDGKIQLGKTFSGVLPMSQWQKAFRLLREKEAIKILLDPSR